MWKFFGRTRVQFMTMPHGFSLGDAWHVTLDHHKLFVPTKKKSKPQIINSTKKALSSIKNQTLKGRIVGHHTMSEDLQTRRMTGGKRASLISWITWYHISNDGQGQNS